MSNAIPVRHDHKAPVTAPLVGGAGAVALLSASCCVLPIGLSILGLGGSWLTWLGPFVAYRTPILVVVFAVLAVAWWRYVRTASEQGSILHLTLLLLSTAAFFAAVSAPWWEREAQQALWQFWVESRR